MKIDIASSAWWGAPKKFDREIKERRISWLELFFDLVYVIAIGRITHHLANHISVSGFFEYASLFILIYWGWLNGSLYHDLHGNEGLRTQLITLWQMMIIAAFAITTEQSSGKPYFNMTIALMIMQFYITYLWWSVGFYDKSHRRYSRPYVILYLLAMALMGLSLYVSAQWLKVIVPLVIICNYTPEFIASRLLRRSSLDLNLSPSMSERLGLFTIIIFGEVVLGVVNGISEMDISNFYSWLNFSFASTIVFLLWWIFFTLTSNREAKKGFVNATLLELLYIPTLISLGLIAASLSGLFKDDTHSLQKLFSYAIAGFLIGISLMTGLLEIPEKFNSIIKPVRRSLLITASVFIIGSLLNVAIDSLYYLVVVIVILIAEISFLNSTYYRFVNQEKIT